MTIGSDRLGVSTTRDVTHAAPTVLPTYFEATPEDPPVLPRNRLSRAVSPSGACEGEAGSKSPAEGNLGRANGMHTLTHVGAVARTRRIVRAA